MRKKTQGNQKYIDIYQQNHAYFVNIACKFIMVTLLIVTRVASQYYFCQNTQRLTFYAPKGTLGGI